MEDWKMPSSLLDGSNPSNTPERSPLTSDPLDPSLECDKIPHHFQNEFLKFIKFEDDKSEETDVSDEEEERMEVKPFPEGSRDPEYAIINQTNVETEDLEVAKIKEEDIPREISTETYTINYQAQDTVIPQDGLSGDSVGGHLIAFNVYAQNGVNQDPKYYPDQSYSNSDHAPLQNPTEPLRWECFSQSGDLVLHTVQTPYYFACPVCGKCFGVKEELEEHSATHIPEVPFSGSECEKDDFGMHKASHEKEKPFSCSVCGKCFGRKNDLEEHKVTHEVEKPFSCSVCGRVFALKDNLEVHKAYFARKGNFERHEPIHVQKKPFSS